MPAHRCEDVCKRGAITFDRHQKAHIDKSKCVECGQCAKVCPYSAIANHKRPCENACKVKAIAMNNDKAAKIDNEKCISCGACVYQCPFGAISDKSYIINVIDMLKRATTTRRIRSTRSSRRLFRASLPTQSSARSSPASKARILYRGRGRAGADMVADAESEELVERAF